MVTRPRKVLSILLASTMLASMFSLPTAVSAADTQAENSDAGTLASYYSTNSTGVGVKKSITVDGEISDWNSSMLIAQGTANDDPRVYRPDSMYEVGIDNYALYGAWDDTNLYLMWEMTNVQDVVATDDNYPLTQGTLYMNQNLPFFIAIDTGKSDAIGNDGKTAAGGTIWDSGISFGNSFNRLIAISTNGANGPYIYGGDSSGLNTVEIYKPTTAGIVFKYGMGILSQNIYGINGGYGTNNGRVVGDMCNDSAAWVDFNTKGHNSSTMDFHYEMSIPLEKLGITSSDIANNGIGVMQVATSGKSGMDCLPYDLSMNDNADLDDAAGSQEKNSFEKSDEDHITAPFARIGKGGVNIPTQKPTTKPTTATQKPISATQSSTTATTGGDTNVTGTKSVTVAKGDVVTFNIKATSSTKKIVAYRLTTAYSKAAFELDTSYSTDGVNTLGATNGTEIVNTHTAGKVKTAVMAKDGSPYNISSTATLQTIKLKALKAGTFDIKYTVDELLNSAGEDLAVNGKVKSSVTVTASTSIKQATKPVTGTTSIAVKKDDTVVLNVNLKTDTALYGFNTDINYDSSLLTLSKVEYPNFTDGTTTKNTTTDGLISAIGVGSPTRTYNYKTEKTLIRATFKAKAAGTAKFTHLMKEVVGLDLVNQFDPSTGKSTVSTTTSNLVAKISTASSNIGTFSKSITVAKGDIVTYVVKANTSSTKFKKYVLTTNYDSTAFSRYTDYSSDGVSTLKLKQGGTESVNVDTAGKIVATVTAASGSPYTASTATNLEIVKFKALKAGTFTVSSTLDSMTNSSGTAMTSSNVTVTGSISKAATYIGSYSNSIKVAKGDVVAYTVKVKTSSKFNKYVITTKYDSAAFDRYTTYSTDGVNTIKASQGGKESVDVSTAGTIKATVTAATDSPYTAATSTNIVIIKLKAKKAGTFTISSTLDSMLNDKNKALTSGNVSVTGSLTKSEVDDTKLTSVSRSIQVKLGEVIVYTVKAKTSTKFNTYKITTTYDSTAFDRYTDYSTDGVTTIKLKQGGTESVNTSTAGKIVATATCKSGTPYTASSETNLQIVKLKAKKAGTYTIGATVNYMKNSSNAAMTTSNVSIRNTASVVIPFTDSRTVTVTKGQTVDYIIAVTLPNKGYDISGWTVDVNYDSSILGVSSTFANGKKFAVGDAAINYATGATTTSASLPGGNMATANFSTDGKVTVMDVKSDGLGLKGKTTKLVCVRFTAKKAGTAVLSYSVTKFVNTKMNTVYINGKYQPINDAEFKMYVKKF